MKRKCACCGGDNFLRGMELMDYSDYGERPIRVRIDRDPSALIFKGAERVETKAEVCDDCGHLQLFIEDRGPLREAMIERGELDPSVKENHFRYNLCKNCNTGHCQDECPKCGVMIDPE